MVRSLFFPWGIEEPLRILNAMEVIFKEKYPNNLHDLYLKSIIQNKDMQNRKPTLRERFLRIRVELRAICVACIPSPMRKLIKKLFFTE